MVRHLSRSLGAGRHAEASGHAALALKATLALALLGAAGAVVRARFFGSAALSGSDAAIVGEGVFAYALWRLFRTLLLAIGEMRRSIFADLAGAVALGVLLAGFVLSGQPDLAVQAFLGVYVVYDVLTMHRALRFARGGSVDEEGKRSFARYNVLWFVGTASSLAARELALLILDARESAAMVGELSVALSLLTMLAFAPRVIDIPLIHELSLLAGREDRGQQIRLTSKALDWLTVVTLQIGFGAAILAGPILAIVANVHTPVRR
jgi:hypothetical protein